MGTSLGFALTAAAAILVSGPNAAGAVELNHRGLGQVLIFPYYTTNGGNATLLSIANTTGRGKALKVRFHEGYDGRSVLDFNVYLAPHDVWVAQVAGAAADAPASLVTGDASCTVPAFLPAPGAGSLRYLDFSMASYAGENTQTGPSGNSDGGPTTVDRTREGHFDVFEMGEVVDSTHASLQAMTPHNGVPANCAQLAAAWSDSGYWTTTASADLDPPRGGLYGSEAIIDVEQGTMYAANAEAIDGFSTKVQHSAPGAASPDLDSASRSDDGTVTAFVSIDGRVRELDYANPVDAISALFMTDMLHNQFSTEGSLGARSDWVVTAPTKRFYVDPAQVGLSASVPFQRSFGQGYTAARVTNLSGDVLDEWAGSFPYACDTVGATVFGRDGALYSVGRLNAGGPGQGQALIPSSQALTPCLETSVLTFSAAESRPGGVPISALGSALTDASDPGAHVHIAVDDVNAIPFEAGELQLDLLRDLGGTMVAQHRLNAAMNGDVLLGLPVIGFVAEDFRNGYVLPGVLANYSGIYPHRASAACTNATTPQNKCL